MFYRAVARAFPLENGALYGDLYGGQIILNLVAEIKY
jgi:hypothetical protein